MVAAAAMAVAVVWAMPTRSSCDQGVRIGESFAPTPTTVPTFPEDIGGGVQPASPDRLDTGEAKQVENELQPSEPAVDGADRQCTHDYCPFHRQRRDSQVYRR